MKQLLRITAIFACIASVICFLVGLFTGSNETLYMAVLVLWCSSLLMQITSSQKNYIHIFFLITVFIFLISRAFVISIETGMLYAEFSDRTMKHIWTVLYLSLLGLELGCHIPTLTVGKRGSSHRYSLNSKVNLRALRMASGLFTAVSGVATFMINLNKVIFYLAFGSGSIETIYVSTLPSIVTYIAAPFAVSMAIYLSTMPNKKQATKVLGFYLAISAIRMLFGSRSEFLLTLMFAYVYYVIRDTFNFQYIGAINEKWIGKKEKLFVVISIPLLILLVVFIGATRTGGEFVFVSLKETLLEFCRKQGLSINILGNAYEYGDRLPQAHFLYPFDNLYTFLTTNPISRIFTGKQFFSMNTVERAIYGTSLDMSLYYIINPTSYLAGIGGGSSYIAELYLGFGYVGVFLINSMLAYVFNQIRKYNYSVMWKNVVMFVFLQSLFLMPRSGFDYWVKDILNTTVLFELGIMYVIYLLFKKNSVNTI